MLLTIGEDPEAAAALEAFGGKHVARRVEESGVDPAHRVVSTPAYLFHTSIAHVQKDIDRLVGAVLALA